MTRISQAEYARSRTPTVSRQYINKLVKAGKISADKDARIDPKEADKVLNDLADPVYEANGSAMKNGGAESEAGNYESDAESPSSGPGLLARARTQQVAYQAKTAEIDYKKKAGELVEVKEVEREAFEAARQTRDTLLSVPQQVAGVLVGMTDEKEIAAYLRGKIKDALMEAAANVGSGISE